MTAIGKSFFLFFILSPYSSFLSSSPLTHTITLNVELRGFIDLTLMVMYPSPEGDEKPSMSVTRWLPPHQKILHLVIDYLDNDYWGTCPWIKANS